MKLFFLGLSLCLASGIASAQSPCADGRFDQAIFSTLIESTGILYGENSQPTQQNPNATQELYLDFYEPEGDTLSQRPLILFAFGGAFVSGSRDNQEQKDFCRYFARRGYVCASIDYRLTPDLFFNNSNRDLYLAVLKAAHDMRAAVRFFRADAAGSQTYRIHPEQIYVGGISAGAIAALHVAYLRSPEEVPVEIVNDTAALGGLSGLSGNPGFSDEVAGVVNWCGALGDSLWVDPDEAPLVSVHGTEDDIVPYGSDNITLFGANLPVDGSSSLHVKLDSVAIPQALYSFQGAGHTPFLDFFSNMAEAYMDTSLRFTRDFLLPQVCAALNTGLAKPSQTMQAHWHPHPLTWQSRLALPPDAYPGSLQVFDLQGRSIAVNYVTSPTEIILSRAGLAPGLYFFRWEAHTQAIPLTGRLMVR